LRKISLIPALILLLLCCLSCDRNRYFDQTLNIQDEGWHKDYTAVFEVEVTDTISLFDFYINLRNTVDYKYSNFYLFLNTELPDGMTARDTIELILADRSGRWLGKGFGKYRDNQLLVRRGLQFPMAGKYVFEIEHAMRDTLLTGIGSAGIRIVHQ
jgi:gliding motility-associated lipoprotein GldH